jgi:hypothetical protein
MMLQVLLDIASLPASVTLVLLNNLLASICSLLVLYSTCLTQSRCQHPCQPR